MLEVLTALLGLQTFYIPEGPANATLREFARQANVNLLFAVDDVKPQYTNAIIGALPPETALKQMLTGTGLVAYFYTNSITVLRLPVIQLTPNIKHARIPELGYTCKCIILGGFERTPYCIDANSNIIVRESCRNDDD